MEKLKKFLSISAMLALSACGTQNNTDEEFGQFDSINAPQAIEVSKETMDELINNVSSPIEMAALLKKEKVPFNKNYLSSTDNIDNLVSEFDVAMNLGLLGTDLGYLNLYEKTGTVMTTVSAINDLTNKLNVGQFFNFELLKRLATNSNNIDSLIYTSISSFNNMDDYLRQNNRTSVSALIVSGVWLESTYLATQVYAKKKNPKIAERIGEQKLILNNLILIIENYKSDQRFSELLVDLNKLKTIYDGVSIVTTDAEPESVVKDGMLVVVQNSKSTVNITNDQIAQINTLVTELRSKVMNVKA